MNVQTIQICFLLFDSMIKLAPWRIVTETMGRIGYGAGEILARSLGVIAMVGAALYAFPPASILGAILPVGYLAGAMASHLQIGSPLLSRILFGIYLGVMVWSGLWLCNRSWRALRSLRSRFFSIIVREYGAFHV